MEHNLDTWADEGKVGEIKRWVKQVEKDPAHRDEYAADAASALVRAIQSDELKAAKLLAPVSGMQGVSSALDEARRDLSPEMVDILLPLSDPHKWKSGEARSDCIDLGTPSPEEARHIARNVPGPKELAVLSAVPIMMATLAIGLSPLGMVAAMAAGAASSYGVLNFFAKRSLIKARIERWDALASDMIQGRQPAGVVENILGPKLAEKLGAWAVARKPIETIGLPSEKPVPSAKR